MKEKNVVYRPGETILRIIEEQCKYLEGSLKIFSKIQRNIITILFYSPTALSPKQIRNKIIELTFHYVFELKDKEKEKIPIFINFNPSPVIMRVPSYPKAVEIKAKKLKTMKLSYYQSIEHKNRLLVEYGISIPSFRTIETVLENLKKNGIVIRQPSSDTKVKNYWTLEPKFYTKLKFEPSIFPDLGFKLF